MDLFAKLKMPPLVDQIREAGVYPYFHELQSRQDTTVIMEGKRRIMLGSNNYLGLTVNEEVCRAAHLEGGVLAHRLHLEDVVLANDGAQAPGKRLSAAVAL